ncbi:MAG: hypothetical protein AAFO99_05715, partial [Bacteroidota bacterium]
MLEDKNQKKTSLEELGEFGLIDHLTKEFVLNHESTHKGIGDDAAVLDFHRPSSEWVGQFQQWYLETIVVPA